MPTEQEYAETKSSEDGDYLYLPASGSRPLACCDCGLVHLVSVHHVTRYGVSINLERDDEETEKARRGRGLRDPLYVEGYDRGAKSTAQHIADLKALAEAAKDTGRKMEEAARDRIRRDVQQALSMAAGGGQHSPEDAALFKRYGWKYDMRTGWRRC